MNTANPGNCEQDAARPDDPVERGYLILDSGHLILDSGFWILDF